MAGEQAQIEKYNALIEALNTLKKQIAGSVVSMNSSADLAKNIMGSDGISTQAVGKIKAATQDYSQVVTEADKLIRELEEEIAQIREILRQAEDL